MVKRENMLHFSNSQIQGKRVDLSSDLRNAMIIDSIIEKIHRLLTMIIFLISLIDGIPFPVQTDCHSHLLNYA